MKKNSIIFKLSIIAVIVVVINMIAQTVYFRLDFTSDKRYTLSNATKNILRNLDDVVTVKAYFSEDLPPQLLNNFRDFRDLLVEYETYANGNLVFEFINPNEESAREEEAQQNGISPIIINVTEKDQVQQMRAYMGANVAMGNMKDVIPIIQPGAAMEYALTTAIKKVSIQDKPKIALLQGKGEHDPNSLSQLFEQLNVLYEVVPFPISENESIPSDYKALLWANPSDTILGSDFDKIDSYLAQGGGVFIAKGTVTGDLSNAALLAETPTGLENWLAKKGIMMGNQFVIDAQAAKVSVRQQTGFMTMNTQIAFPYFPRINNFGDHPIAQGLEEVMLPFVNPIEITSTAEDLSITPLLYSTSNSGHIRPPAYIDINKRWTQQDFPLEQQILAVAAEGNFGGSIPAKLVVVANGTFFWNGESGQQQQNADNINLASNSVDWLADDTGLIDLRTKGVTSRPLDQVEDDTKTLLKYGNVLLPIFAMLLYALIRKQRNMRRKQRWMQGQY